MWITKTLSLPILRSCLSELSYSLLSRVDHSEFDLMKIPPSQQCVQAAVTIPVSQSLDLVVMGMWGDKIQNEGHIQGQSKHWS